MSNNVIPFPAPHGSLQWWVRQSPTPLLRALWKEEDLCDHLAEVIHAEMNRRGLGREVAV